MLTQLRILAMNVQQAITALREHPTRITDLAAQARTIPSHKETLHWIVYHVIQANTVLGMEMTNQPTIAVLDFFVQEEIVKQSPVQHGAHQVISAVKGRTI